MFWIRSYWCIHFFVLCCVFSEPNTSSTLTPSTDPSTVVPPKKKRRWDTGTTTTTTATTTIPSTTDIKPIISTVPLIPSLSSAATTLGLSQAQQAAAIQQQVAARLKQLNLPTLSTATIKTETSTATPSIPSAFIGLTPSVGTIPIKTESNQSKSGWVPLRLDAQGRQIDAAGNVVETQRISTAKINQRKEGEEPNGSAVPIRNKIPDLIPTEEKHFGNLKALLRDI